MSKIIYDDQFFTWEDDDLNQSIRVDINTLKKMLIEKWNDPNYLKIEGIPEYYFEKLDKHIKNL